MPETSEATVGEKKAEHSSATRSWSLTAKYAPWPGLFALGLIVVYIFQGQDALRFSRIAAGILLSLSIFADIGLLQIKNVQSRFSVRLGLCECLKILFLLIYMFGARLSEMAAFAWSLAAMLAGIAIAVGMTNLAGDLLQRRSRPDSARNASNSSSANSLSDELRRNKLVALCGILVSFLHVTYCFSFALAISDTYRKGDLYATTLIKPDPLEVAGGSDVRESDANGCSPAKFGEVRKLMFLQSEGALRCTRALYDAVEVSKQQKVVCENDLDHGLLKLSKVKVPLCDDKGIPGFDAELRSTAMSNLRQLYELRAMVHTINLRAAPQDQHKRTMLIEVRGHANETNIKNQPRLSYASNFEISKQRADQVTVLLSHIFQGAIEDLEQPPIRWLSYGVADESTFLETDDSNWSKEARQSDFVKKLSVEIRVQRFSDSFSDRHLRDAEAHLRDAQASPRTLDLIDYIYFTTYTITTTGYGDIIPTSNFAKVLVTIANLLELLFIAVIFQVVAGARDDDNAIVAQPSGGADGS